MWSYNEAVRTGILAHLSGPDLFNEELTDQLESLLVWDDETQRYLLPDPATVHAEVERIKEESK